MPYLEKKVIGVDVGSKILVMNLLNSEGNQVIVNVCNNKADMVRNLKK